jgi:hypothetical protein
MDIVRYARIRIPYCHVREIRAWRKGNVMELFLITIVVIGVMLVMGLAFNMIRPGKLEWHQYEPEDQEWQSHHQDSWRDAH